MIEEPRKPQPAAEHAQPFQPASNTAAQTPPPVPAGPTTAAQNPQSSQIPSIPAAQHSQQFEPAPAPIRIPVKFSSKYQNPRRHLFFLASTFFIFILQYFSTVIFSGDVLSIIGMKDNTAILAGQVWRLITPIWLHAGILHILSNMYALFVIGPGLKDITGMDGFWHFTCSVDSGEMFFHFCFPRTIHWGHQPPFLG